MQDLLITSLSLNISFKVIAKSSKTKFYTEKEFLSIDFYLKAKRSIWPNKQNTGFQGDKLDAELVDYSCDQFTAPPCVILVVYLLFTILKIHPV